MLDPQESPIVRERNKTIAQNAIENLRPQEIIEVLASTLVPRFGRTRAEMIAEEILTAVRLL